jgi:hypothetical protein
MLDGVREHYTADPVLEGVADPAGVPRVGVLEGRPAVAPPEWTDEATERAREAREAAKLAAARAAAARDWQDARAAGDVPRMLRARHRIMKNRKISKREWYELVSRFKLDAIELALKY